MDFVIGLLMAAVAATTTLPAAGEKTLPRAAVERIPVFLQTDTRDLIGATYVTRLREAFDESSAYRPVRNPAMARFIVGVLTMDPNEADVESGTGLSTVAAVTLQREGGTGLNQFVYSWVLVARLNTVNSLVTELVSAIDKEIRELEGSTILVR